MLPTEMGYQDMRDFLMEYHEDLIEVLLSAYRNYVDEVVADHFSEEASNWVSEYGEVC